MNVFNTLSTNENRELLKFPAYVSILAANSDNDLDDAEKKSAINFAHTKTFTCDSLLFHFYEEVDKVFKTTIYELDSTLPKDQNERDEAIKKELSKLEKIVSKLGKEYANVMHQSMESFAKHVSKAHYNVLEDFIFSVPVTGINN